MGEQRRSANGTADGQTAAGFSDAGSIPRDRSGTVPTEAEIARYWEAARLPAGCRTADGRALDVIYRGQWSRGYGPDFRSAILSFGPGPAVRGDVEIHVCSSMWRQHGHERNPAYDRVALHVVWLADTSIASPAPVLELSRYVSPDDLLHLPDPGALDASLCAVFRSPEQAARARSIIAAAGDERFEARCAVLEGELACEEPEQVLYAALMECMGYSENKLPFRLLAEAVPYATLGNADAQAVTRRLITASGLSETGPDGAALRREQWNLARVRPANHPLRRMHGIGSLVATAERHGGLVAWLTDARLLGEPKLLVSRVVSASGEDAPAIGADRATETACNAILPFAIAYARTSGDPALEDQALNGWRRLPRAGSMRIEKAMRDHLTAPAGTRLLGTARHQQGLLHLYKRYCAQRLCDLCPLSRLAESGS